MLNRRKFITGLISFAAAPAIVKIENIMPVKSYGLIADQFFKEYYSPWREKKAQELADKLANDIIYGTNYTGLHPQADWDRGFTGSLVNLLKDMKC